MYWDVSSPSLFDIILCTCIDMILNMSKGLTRENRSCWDRVMIILLRGDRLWDGEVMIIIWAREYCLCESYLIYDSALRLSAQTRGDRPCRYMDLASPPWVMNSRCISEEYHVYTVEWVLVFWDISLYGILLHCISSHHSFFMIMCFVLCLGSTWCLITLLMKLK